MSIAILESVLLSCLIGLCGTRFHAPRADAHKPDTVETEPVEAPKPRAGSCLRLPIGSAYNGIPRRPILPNRPAASVGTQADTGISHDHGWFTMTVFPTEIADAIYDQRIVVLVAIEDHGPDPVSAPVVITAAATGPDATVSVVPESLLPNQVCEVTVIPIAPPPHQLVRSDTANARPPFWEGDELILRVCGRRGQCTQMGSTSINLLPGGDGRLEAASVVRDRFVPFLADHHPGLGITRETPWTGTIVKPHFLVVSHYLFFSEEWEMGVLWHNTIPPYDWGRIYLRHRHKSFAPQYAFEIASLSTQPLEMVVPVEPPTQVDR
jgi:hypothetical protein